jgi:hypothetical protein
MLSISFVESNTHSYQPTQLFDTNFASYALRVGSQIPTLIEDLLF